MRERLLVWPETIGSLGGAAREEVTLDDLQALLSSSADPDYLVLPKCGSSALIEWVGNLLREAGKTAQIIALIESAKGVGALDEIAGGDAKPAAAPAATPTPAATP